LVCVFLALAIGVVASIPFNQKVSAFEAKEIRVTPVNDSSKVGDVNDSFDFLYDSGQYHCWASPARPNWYLELSYSLTGTVYTTGQLQPFNVLLLANTQYLNMVQRGVYPTSGFMTQYSRVNTPKATQSYVSGTLSASENYWLCVLSLLSCPTTRIAGQWYLASTPFAAMPVIERSIFKPDPTAVESMVGSGKVIMGEVSTPFNISLEPGDMWISSPVPMGADLDIGYLINATNRFNILLVDKANLELVKAHRLFNFYVFYSRMDVFGAHLEVQAVDNLPADVYLIIDCVDSFQSVQVFGNIIFKKGGA